MTTLNNVNERPVTSEIPSVSPQLQMSIPTSENFASRVIEIVQQSAQSSNIKQIDEPWEKLISFGTDEEIRQYLPKIIRQVQAEQSANDLSEIYNNLLNRMDVDPLSIENFSSYPEEFRIACAKFYAQRDGDAVSRNIQNYGITNQDALIEIAKIAAQQDGRGVSEYIQNYGITNQDALIEIAKIAAQQDGRGVSEYIQNYGITSQDALIEIAKIAAQQDGGGVSEYIQNYGITSQNALIEIAKLAAQQDGWGTSEHIQNYGITSQDALIEIAKLAAKQSSQGTSKYIQNYGITNQDALIEIAKIAAQQDGWGVSSCIQNYGITSQDALLKIVTLALQQSELDILVFLENYSLNPKNRAAVIARFVSALPELMQNMAKHFPEKDHTAILELYPELRIFGITDDPISEFNFLFEIDKVPPFLSEKRTALYQDMFHEKDPEIKTLKTKMLRVFCSILDFSDGSPALLKNFYSLFTSIEQEKNPYIKDQKLCFIAALLMHCREKSVDKTAIEEQFSLLNEIFALQDPRLHSYLSHAFVENLSNPALRGFLKENISGIQQKKNQCATADLSLLLLAPLVNTMVPYVEMHFPASKTHILEEDPKIQYVSFIERMQGLLNHSYFQRDRLKTKSLLRSLSTLVKTSRLSNTQKTTILRDLIFIHELITIQGQAPSKNQYCAQLLRSAEIVALLIDCDQLDRLTSITSRELSDQIPEVFASILKITIPDCNEKVLNTFATWRKPSALLTYAGKLQSFPMEGTEKVLLLLKKYAESVLNGTFAPSRYDTSASTASEHWLKIYEKDPGLVAEWKKGSRISEGMFDVVDTDDPCDLLLSGTEVGSCQNVDDSPLYNKCLTAYLMDPKIRMMAVKNKNGVTVARCMMRLLWDKKAQKFVLFQEKKYPKVCNPSFEKMLDNACKKRAEQLGVALLVKDETAQETDITTLQAFKGEAPFEYVDAITQKPIQTDSGYEIDQCRYVYRPENFG